MNGASALHDLDFVVFGVPLIFFLVVAFFRLDHILASSKAGGASRATLRPFAEREHKNMFTDPDGRPWD